MPRSEAVSQKSILIVEDEPDIRDSLQEALELEGYEIKTACDGKTAIELLDQIGRPCLILLDLMMPVMDGWEFRRVQKANPEIAAIPVVVISAHVKMHTVEANDYIAKPMENLEQLLACAEKYCR